MPKLAILWDDSHIWGLLAARAVLAMGLPVRILRAAEIAEGALENDTAALIVPGGTARHKAESLGPAGMDAIRWYVASGGAYIGFCGGAGLALTPAHDSKNGSGHGQDNHPGPVTSAVPSRAPGAALGPVPGAALGPTPGIPGAAPGTAPGLASSMGGLALCPWKRGAYEDRMQHFMSGHMRVALPTQTEDNASFLLPQAPGQPGVRQSAELPVWWPGRFDADMGGAVTVLASYMEPAADFWLADLPIADLPHDIFSAWRDLYGVSISPSFLEGQPCVATGQYGKGRYVISYSHLETPASETANRWFAHLVHELSGLQAENAVTPPWHVHGEIAETHIKWPDPALAAVAGQLGSIRQSALQHGLIFQRTSWLMGWRAGLPGANLNNLWATLAAIRSLPPSETAHAFWQKHCESVTQAAQLFSEGCIHYLLTERLSQTLSRFLPDAVPPAMLKEQRERLFGPPLHPGGLYKDILEPFDELAYLQLRERKADSDTIF